MRRLGLALVGAVTGVVLACGSFSGTDPVGPAPPDGSADGSPVPPPDGDGGPVDGGSPDAAKGDAGLECTPPAAPSCDPDACTKRTLYGKSGGYPFGIVSDANYVYWIEQQAPGDAYNGDGIGRVLRVDRTGALDDSRVSVLATNLPRASAIALDGTNLYVTSLEGPDGGAPKTHLRRIPAGCMPPCAVDDLTLNVSFDLRFFRLLRAAPGVLFGLAGNSQLYRIAIAATGAKFDLTDTVGVYPGATVTDRAAYLASSGFAATHRISIDGASVDKSFATLPPLADAGVGLVQLATDCTNLYGTRSTSFNGDMLMAVSLATRTPSIVTGGTKYGYYDLTADARWVYGGAVNTGGLIVIDPQDGGVRNVQPANVFALWTDDQGVYIGDHSGNGKIIMMVK